MKKINTDPFSYFADNWINDNRALNQENIIATLMKVGFASCTEGCDGKTTYLFKDLTEEQEHRVTEGLELMINHVAGISEKFEIEKGNQPLSLTREDCLLYINKVIPSNLRKLVLTDMSDEICSDIADLYNGLCQQYGSHDIVYRWESWFDDQESDEYEMLTDIFDGGRDALKDDD